MGDRANIKIRDTRDKDIYLYTHWEGTGLPVTLQKALIGGKDRWDDELYLTRIIFSEMTSDDVGGITGYGISTYVADGDDKIITVNMKYQEIDLNGKSYSFQEYVDLTEDKLKFS